MDNNICVLSGEVISDFRFSHEIYGEKFFQFDLRIERLSGVADIIPVTVSERLIDIKNDILGRFVNVNGDFRSYNNHIGEKTHLVLFAFARSIEVADSCDNTNSVDFDGYICKKPNYRKTPLGRDIADILLAVNRPYGKSDYIPCIVWGRNATYVNELPVGTRLNISGRIQSREYVKHFSETECETKVAYEVSATKLKVVEE